MVSAISERQYAALITMRNTDKILLAGILFWGVRSLTAISLPLYLLSSGVSLSVIAFSKSIQLIIIGLFSFATGILSDRFGAKRSVVLASALQVLYFFLIAQASSSAVYTAEALNGLSLALYNGCYEKWLHDEKESGFSRHYALYQKWRFLLMGLFVFIGGFFRESSLYAAAGLLTVVTVFFFLCRENACRADSRIIVRKESLWFLSNGRLLIISVFYVVTSAMMASVYSLWPAQFLLTNMTVYPGSIYLAAMIFQWAVMHSMSKLMEKNNRIRAAYMTITLVLPTSTLLVLSLVMYMGIAAWLQALSVAAMFLMLSMPTAVLSICFIEMNRLYVGSRASFISLIDTLIKLLSSLVMFLLTFNQKAFLATTWLMVSVFSLMTFIPVAYMLLSGMFGQKVESSHK